VASASEDLPNQKTRAIDAEEHRADASGAHGFDIDSLR
jgi:hypothetical protein